MGIWPLVGRDEELALFQRLLLEDGRGVVIVAPPGTGKTRLLHKATRRAGEVAATESLAGSRSAQALPLAAVAALLPSHTPTVTEPLDLFRAARRTLLERAGDRPVVVAVDEAHLLDPLSAALIHHLAITDGVRFLVAVRAGEPVEDAITALWRDGIAERVDLQPLGPEDVSNLLRAVLEGEVEAATAWRLWSVAGGNPLYLHEVVTEALRVGTLTTVGGVWCWRGQVRVGARLRELVELRLSNLDDAERAVVALLAVGDSLDREVVEAACQPRAVAALQQRGFVASERSAHTTALTLDHPLFAEVVRNSMTTTERAQWCRLLARSVDPAPGSDLALLRQAVWQIDGGEATDAALLTRAAERANNRFDGALAERLARAALDAGGGDHARLVLAEACRWLAHYGDAMAHAESLEQADLSDEHLARLATVVAEAGFFGLRRVRETEAALSAIATRVGSEVARQRVRAQQSAMMLAAGNRRGAGELGLSIAADDDADAQARFRAITAAGAGLCVNRGRPEDTLLLCERLLPLAFAQVDDFPRGLGWVIAASLTALACLGRWDDAENLLHPVRENAIAEGDHEAISGSSLVLGRLALSRGDLVEAGIMLREAVAELRTHDSAGYLQWGLAMQAQVAAQRGDATAARDAAEELDRIEWVVMIYNHEVAIGRAWAAAMDGEVTAPLRILFEAAAAARAEGNLFTEGMLLHEALRLGANPRDLVERLEVTAASGGLPYHETFLAHARALVADDGVALDAVAESFEQTGMMLLAAECAAEAVAAHRGAGRASRASRSAGYATRLLARCPGARTPIQARMFDVPDLTRREREMCALAARGLSNNAIATQLGVGIRTVEGHLHRAMTKLGVNSRQELDAALAPVENA